MKKMFVYIFLLNILLILASGFYLPDRVATHFGSGGMPNGWASRDRHMLISMIMTICLFLVFFSLPRLVRILPSSSLNLPDRNFWLKEENRQQLVTILETGFYEFGTAMMLFLFCISLLTCEANLKIPAHLNEPVMIALLALFLAYSAYWGIQFYRSLKKPKT